MMARSPAAMHTTLTHLCSRGHLRRSRWGSSSGRLHPLAADSHHVCCAMWQQLQCQVLTA